MIGSVYKKEVEIGIGCLYNYFYEYVELSKEIAKSGITIVVPAPKYIYSSNYTN